MSAALKAEVLSVHKTRRPARRRERAIQHALDGMRAGGISVKIDPDGTYRPPQIGAPDVALPAWTQGVRVQKAGPFSYCVIATPTRGH